jgi:uncharacterized protein
LHKLSGQSAHLDRGEAEILHSIDTVEQNAWNALAGNSPFVRHEFLSALERNGCVGQEFGWLPCHIVIRSYADQLIGAMPMYAKTNSYGEFVFDWSWASAYDRAGIDYYPKLVCAIPYTPATGRRFLISADVERELMQSLLIETAIELARSQQCSGVHWLFTEVSDTEFLSSKGLVVRLGCQYHWKNEQYRDFDDFLDSLISRKRKKIRRERQRVMEQGLSVQILTGSDCDASTWKRIHGFYVDTFKRKSGIATLTLDFFEEIGKTMGDQVILTLVKKDQDLVACAISFRDESTLYGRFWGCLENYHSLHFETCYYQGIDYCIREGLSRFEPGAQGEHKISRGFLPTKTWSAHWIENATFRNAIRDFCQREQRIMDAQCAELSALSPFKGDSKRQ